MSHDLIAQSVLVPHLAPKQVVVKMEEDHSSSDGGAVLLKGIDRCLGLTQSLTE